MNALGERVRRNIVALREKRGLSIEELAKHADLHRSTLYNIEGRKVSASLETITKLAQALRVTPDDLLAPDEGEQAAIDQRAALDEDEKRLVAAWPSLDDLGRDKIMTTLEGERRRMAREAKGPR